MASQKDKEYHMLRNPEKYGLITNDTYGKRTQEGAEAYAKFKKLWSKFGFKSMVGDKRRRNQTRKSNQKDKQLLHQVERARYKVSLRNHLVNDDAPVTAIQSAGNIIVIK